MRKIKIMNFGPIKKGFADNSGYLNIYRVTILIGNQGTGKSSIAKLISTFSWLEKALFLGKITINDVAGYNRFQKKYCAHLGIQNYFQKDTYLEFCGHAYHFLYEYGDLAIVPVKNNEEYKTPKITFFPAERNFLSVVEKPGKAKGLPFILYTFLEEYEKAQQELSGKMDLPLRNIKFEFQKQNKIAYILGNGYKLRLSEASSGLQSLAPLFLVLQYLTSSLTKEDDPAIIGPSIDEQRKIDDEITRIIENPEYSTAVKNLMIERILQKQKNDFLINIIEEIEQNLFPESQKSLLFKTFEFTNANTLNELILTTHSPYIVDYLTLAMKGYEVLQFIDGKNRHDLKDELVKVIPITACINAEQAGVYELDEAGNIIQLENKNGVISDSNYLNSLLAETNNLFDKLLEIEDKVI